MPSTSVYRLFNKIAAVVHKNTKDFHLRLQLAARQRGISRNIDFARKLKVGTATAHKWWTGNTAKISAEDALMICDALEISVRWLIYGTGSQSRRVSLTEGEIEALDLFKALPHEWRDHWLKTGQQIVERLRVPAASPETAPATLHQTAPHYAKRGG